MPPHANDPSPASRPSCHLPNDARPLSFTIYPLTCSVHANPALCNADDRRTRYTSPACARKVENYPGEGFPMSIAASPVRPHAADLHRTKRKHPAIACSSGAHSTARPFSRCARLASTHARFAWSIRPHYTQSRRSTASGRQKFGRLTWKVRCEVPEDSPLSSLGPVSVIFTLPLP
ncbi:hypothetical protein B0H10DRAFT_2431552 [Mycena sp. CBHHK59/15]|nr:hypothetical protein B0H10DRAFT_2431552 [Mycena sp. CBHHK59/15]